MNRKRFVGVIVLVVVLLVCAGAWFFLDAKSDMDVSCVPAGCCHSNACVLESEASDCSEHLCSMSCEPGTMDCGQGHCEYVDGECGVVWDE